MFKEVTEERDRDIDLTGYKNLSKAEGPFKTLQERKLTI